ncbi:MAG TPA: rhamnogalacturonan lyase, partial [Polyangiaceae bacterium]|nr:rhamnogalacturonan lyase [Polyangiaceae bacterium]
VTDSTNLLDEGAPGTATYTVRAVLDGVELGDSANDRAGAGATRTWNSAYAAIPLANSSGYTAGDTSVGDLDGDGQYELVVKEEQTPRDPSQDGVTGQPKFAAYELDGTFLWRVDLGVNIRESEHTTPFVVYDLDGDGSAELAVKTAPGTRDGTGAYLSDGPAASDDDGADYRNSAGRILGGGPEYLTIFGGRDGAELATIAYHAPFDSGYWGDDYGNRSDRYNATLAFLDETGRPSVVMQRGYYERTTFGAYAYRDGRLTLVWTFDSSASGNGAFARKGTHSLMAADADGDLRQEIIPGPMTIGPDGRGLCAVDFSGHGDALHVADLIPSRPGLEVFQPTEAEGVPSYFVRDALTCEIVWQSGNSSGEGPGRGAADDITPDNPGGEVWVNSAGLFSAADGGNVGSNPSACNFLIWWDGDESRELLNGNTVSEYDRAGQGFSASGCSSINGTKSVPNLSADLFGDWREEVVFSCGGELRIYTTTQLTSRRIRTLMHDPQYRANVSSQNTTYNQPPHTSFHIGDGMAEPPAPSIHVR